MTISPDNCRHACGQADKDGGTDAWLLAKAAASGNMYQNVTASGILTFSVYAKAGTLNWARLRNSVSGSTFWFDLANGVVGTTGSVIASAINSVGNGWYRISISESGTNGRYRIYPADGDGDTSATSGNILIQNAQLEDGLVSTPYIATTTVAVSEGPVANLPRLNSVAGGCPSLLLEPQRTNLITQSEYIGSSYWDKKTSTVTGGHISPIGQLNAYKVVEGSLDGLQWIESSQVSTAAGDLTLSLYVKSAERTKIGIRDGISGAYATFDLSLGTVLDNSAGTDGGVESLPNGYYRLTLTITSGTSIFYALYILSDTYVSGAPSDHTYQGDGTSGIYIYGAQAEEGSYATSYIPTYGTAATRVAESSITSANTLGGLSVGTFFIEMTRQGIDTSETGSAVSLRDNAGAEELRLHFDAPTSQVRWRDGNNSYAQVGNALPVTAGTAFKIIIKSDGTTAKVFGNGLQLGSDYSIVSAFDFQRIYNYQLGYEIKQQLFFPTALTDAECIELTTL